MRPRVLAVAVLAVLAGCGGLTTGGDAPATSTLTPAPVPDLGLPAAEGVGDGGIDAEQIVDKHREILEANDYTLTETIRVGPSDNASYHERTRAHVAAGGTPLLIDDEITAAREGYLGRGTDVWWNGDRAFYRYTFAGGQHSYYYVDQQPSGHLYIDRRLDDVLGAVSITNIEAGPGNSTIVAGTIDDTSVVPATTELRAMENATVTVQIRGDGVVSRMALGYDAIYYDQGRQRVRYTYRIRDVGSTTVAPPDWLKHLEEFRGED